MRVLLLLVMLIPMFAIAEERRHMVSFGRSGLGASSSYEDLDTKSSSPFNSVKFFLNDIGLNYAYRIGSRVQLGALWEWTHNEYKLHSKSGNKSFVETEDTAFGVFALYNFSDDLNDSWYAGYSFKIIDHEEENSHEFEDSEGKAPFEFDDTSSMHEMIVGKRFSLRGWKVDNLAFSPLMTVYYKTHGKDFDDNGIGNGTGVTLQPLRFDLLF